MCDPDSIKEEPIPGLPDDLPEGEDILWRGGPDWKALAMHVFHVRAVAIYFAIILIWQVTSAVMDGTAFNVALANSLMLIPMAFGAIGLLCLLAWLMARSTIYTITTERVVIRAGVALPKAINIPFALVESAALNLRKTGNGDIPLKLTSDHKAYYIPLWPHVRPWKLLNAQPMLRGLPDAQTSAEVLSRALANRSGQPATPITVETPAPVRPQAMPGQTAAANS
jgi:hypothetical protein